MVRHFKLFKLNNFPEGEIVLETDPKTGEIIQQLVQTVIDPQTGKPTQVTIPVTAGILRC